jgi:Ca-activated chloride channel family protein
MGHFLRWPFLAAIVLILAPTSGQPAHGGPFWQFSAAVRQVEVYATVTGTNGRPVRDLTAQDFAIAEDGVPQTITTFSAGEFPATVALVIDRSFSMAGAPLTMARTAGRVFLASLRPEDRVMLIGIGGEVEALAPLDVDRAPLVAALDKLDAWGTTSLHDAIITSLDLLEPEPGRRAIVLLSDGGDRYSRASAADVIERVKRSNILIYPVAIGRRAVPFLSELALFSGGRAIGLPDPKGLARALTSVAEDLRWQYLLGYSPSKPWGDAPEWRQIAVDMTRMTRLRVQARRGYLTK